MGGSWLDEPSVCLKVDLSDFLLPVEAVSNSSRIFFFIYARGDITRLLLRRCCLTELLQESVRNKAKNVWSVEPFSAVLLFLSMWKFRPVLPPNHCSIHANLFLAALGLAVTSCIYLFFYLRPLLWLLRAAYGNRFLLSSEINDQPDLAGSDY